MADQLLINEIFHSIQGESTWTGCPCVFIRLRGCHLRCHYCDTEYAFKDGRGMVIADIITQAEQWPTRLAEITGGEPLLQQPVHALITQLCDRNWTVLIETSGACDISTCDPRSIRIMDIKTPGSGESARNLWSNIDHLTARDEVKFIITDHADYQWARQIIEQHDLGSRCNAVLMSAVFDQPAGQEISGCTGLDLHTLADWLLNDPPARGGPIRMQTQLHKFIWHPQTRGV